MELERRKPKQSIIVKTINLYKDTPSGHLNLDECQDLFRQRLEALHIFEKYPDLTNTNAVDQIKTGFRDIRSHVYKANCIRISINDEYLQNLDHLSHMLARLYFIHHYTDTLWKWFVNGEKKLMYYRLKYDMSPTGDQLESVLRQFEFDFERVSIEELGEMKRENMLGWCSRDRDHMEVFKIHFLNALKFISKRSISLKDGYAYLTRSEIISVVCDVFEKHLNLELEYARQHLDINNSQVIQLIDSLDVVYSDFNDKINEDLRKQRHGDKENRNPYSINLEDIEELCKNHYPPCMRYLHESLKEDHHLKHSGRLFYGTFLRSGQVEMDDAIEFWRKEFTKKIPNDKFDRDYKYNIRHLYGREGHKKALSCFSCDKIISDNPGPTDKHGCPFKHFDDSKIRNMMSKHGVGPGDIEDIMGHRKNQEYKLACSYYFGALKGRMPSEPIRVPIQFFNESIRVSRNPITDCQMDADGEVEQKLDEQGEGVINLGQVIPDEEEVVFDDL